MFDANIARAHSEKQKWCVIYNTELTSILSITINISKVMTTIPNGSRHRFRLLREQSKKTSEREEYRRHKIVRL